MDLSNISGGEVWVYGGLLAIIAWCLRKLFSDLEKDVAVGKECRAHIEEEIKLLRSELNERIQREHDEVERWKQELISKHGDTMTQFALLKQEVRGIGGQINDLKSFLKADLDKKLGGVERGLQFLAMRADRETRDIVDGDSEEPLGGNGEDHHG